MIYLYNPQDHSCTNNDTRCKGLRSCRPFVKKEAIRHFRLVSSGCVTDTCAEVWVVGRCCWKVMSTSFEIMHPPVSGQRAAFRGNQQAAKLLLELVCWKVMLKMHECNPPELCIHDYQISWVWLLAVWTAICVFLGPSSTRIDASAEATGVVHSIIQF